MNGCSTTHSFITAHKMGIEEADARLISWSAYPAWYIQESTPPGANGLTSDTLTFGLTMNQHGELVPHGGRAEVRRQRNAALASYSQAEYWAEACKSKNPRLVPRPQTPRGTPELQEESAKQKSQRLSATPPCTTGPNAPPESHAQATPERTKEWDTTARAECERRMRIIGVPNSRRPAMLALLTDPQSNVRPHAILTNSTDFLECCRDALHDLGYPDEAGALRIRQHSRPQA